MSTAISFIVSSDSQDYHISTPNPPDDWNSFFEALMDHLALSSMDTPLYYLDSDNNKHPIVGGSLFEMLMDQTDNDIDLFHNSGDTDDQRTSDLVDTDTEAITNDSDNDNTVTSYDPFNTDDGNTYLLDTQAHRYNTAEDDPNNIDSKHEHNHHSPQDSLCQYKEQLYNHDVYFWSARFDHIQHRHHQHPHQNLLYYATTSMDSSQQQLYLRHIWHDQHWKRRYYQSINTCGKNKTNRCHEYPLHLPIA